MCPSITKVEGEDGTDARRVRSGGRVPFNGEMFQAKALAPYAGQEIRCKSTDNGHGKITMLAYEVSGRFICTAESIYCMEDVGAFGLSKTKFVRVGKCGK